MTEKHGHFLARTAARKDSNQAGIERFLRQCGYYCWTLHKAGMGVPDLLVLSKSGVPVLFEIKMPGEKLTPREELFFKLYTAPRQVVESGEQALEVMEYWDEAKIEIP